jgi:transposase
MEERDSDPGILLADRGYDSDVIRQDVRDRGGQPEIPSRRNRRIQHSVQRPLYARRFRIERCINRLKNYRRVATRYDHTASSFLGFV